MSTTRQPRPRPGGRSRDKPRHDSTAQFERLLKSAATAKRYVLKLYVTGTTPRSTQAVANIRALCDEHLAGRYDLEVVDIYQQPGIAAGDQIIAAPTLVKQLPAPPRRMVGDFSDRNKVLIGLDLRETERAADAPAKPQWMRV